MATSRTTTPKKQKSIIPRYYKNEVTSQDLEYVREKKKMSKEKFYPRKAFLNGIKQCYKESGQKTTSQDVIPLLKEIFLHYKESKGYDPFRNPYLTALLIGGQSARFYQGLDFLLECKTKYETSSPQIPQILETINNIIDNTDINGRTTACIVALMNPAEENITELITKDTLTQKDITGMPLLAYLLGCNPDVFQKILEKFSEFYPNKQELSDLIDKNMQEITQHLKDKKYAEHINWLETVREPIVCNPKQAHNCFDSLLLQLKHILINDSDYNFRLCFGKVISFHPEKLEKIGLSNMTYSARQGTNSNKFFDDKTGYYTFNYDKINKQIHDTYKGNYYYTNSRENAKRLKDILNSSDPTNIRKQSYILVNTIQEANKTVNLNPYYVSITKPELVKMLDLAIQYLSPTSLEQKAKDNIPNNYHIVYNLITKSQTPQKTQTAQEEQKEIPLRPTVENLKQKGLSNDTKTITEQQTQIKRPVPDVSSHVPRCAYPSL